jgi:cysteinyl-tRNA synthetase
MIVFAASLRFAFLRSEYTSALGYTEHRLVSPTRKEQTMSNFAHTASPAGQHARDLLLESANRRRRASRSRSALTLLTLILLIGLAVPLIRAAVA